MRKIKSILLGAILSLVLPFNVFASDNKVEKVEQGQATVNEVVKSGNREFYTIVTPSQQTYYLVIDFLEKERNVYFLKAVDEIDLLDLAGVGEVIYTPEETTKEITTETTTESVTEQTSDEVVEEQEESEEKPKIDITLILGIVILGVAIFFFIKNKKDNKNKENMYLDEAIQDDNEEVIFNTEEQSKEEEQNNKKEEDKKALEDMQNLDL
nr:DUF4366 domain-containing protein [uncultured Tyzzerella sp.]